MRILAFAYACAPREGSEPGAGWAWSRMLAGSAETWVLTRANNAPAIEAELARIPESERPHVVYVDLPRWARFWKRGQRGVRLYYLLWQVAAVRRARRLQRDRPFDLAWHLTLANAWLGSLAPLTGLPFVYGPVGGGVSVPWRLAPALGLRGTAYELLRAAARSAGRYVNPAARLAWRRANLILVQNADTARWLPKLQRSKTAVFPNVALEDGPALPGDRRRPSDHPPTALFAGRLLPLKGVALAIRAIARLPEWTLLVAGSGSDERRLRRLARRLGVDGRVHFLGWLPREDLLRAMTEEADVFLFPSLHEESGWVVAEALSRGVPVVHLDLGGPPAVAGRAGFAAPVAGGQDRVVSSLAALIPIARAASASTRMGDESWAFETRRGKLADLLAKRLGPRADRVARLIDPPLRTRNGTGPRSVAATASDGRKQR